MFKIVPDDFFEPDDEPVLPKQRTIKKPPQKSRGLFYCMARLEGLFGPSCPHPFGAIQQKTLMLKIVPDDFFEPNDEPVHYKTTNNKKAPSKIEGAFLLYGAPGRIRTSDRSVRSRVLYPAELQAHNCRLSARDAII